MSGGILQVHLRHARHLKNVEWILSGEQDPFVKLTCGNTTMKSKTHKDGGKNPTWDESFTFNNVTPDMTLILEIYNENLYMKHTKIGTCTVDVRHVDHMEGKVFNGELDVITKGKPRGKLAVEVAYVRPVVVQSAPHPAGTTQTASTEAPRVTSAPVPAPAPAANDPSQWLLGMEYAGKDCWKDYEPGKLLGKGTFGTTYAAICRKTREPVAVKVISKRKLRTPEEKEDVKREVQIMHHLAGHKNVVCVKGVYEDKANVCIAMEVCNGGELFDAIVKRGRYTERDAANIIRVIVDVVAHCHNMGVIHRDLKPENFLLKDKGDTSVLKATDFGLSSFFKENQVFDDIVGSAYYVAPEVLKRKYSKEADIWSCGVILYILLCGYPPFTGADERKIFENVMNKPVDFSSAPWPSISEAAKNCVKRMLQRDPAKRATAREILQDDWMRENGCASDAPLQLEVLNRFKKFAGLKAFPREVMKIIATRMPVDEINGIRNMFYDIDKDKSGTITVKEFGDALRKRGTLLPETELARIMQEADANGDGTIDYEEFLAATMNQIKIQDDTRLLEAFRTFDTDGNGRISKAELVKGLGVGQPGCKTTMAEIDEIFEEVDADRSGEIDFIEFRTMMLTL